MAGCRGGKSSPAMFVLLATLIFVAVCRAGPVGPLPNVTSADMGLKEGSCALGDVVYLPGDDFPGSDPCEKCKCSNGGVQCEKQQCEPRPGCKALHRPDHCCPTYQCECEQEGRVYSNGEKLVDPADPCRVCYCQGGEVVCRTIACFVRDDCSPRLVPGRCCPEYDNCPVRGVTVLPGMSSLSPHPSTREEVKNSPAPTPPKENIKQEITIKEITPVSEIPVITDVKIKEILPSSIDVAEYSSSKSPLIPREATSEKSVKSDAEAPKAESPTITEVHPSTAFEESKADNNKDLDDTPPSKISFSTQDSINSDIYPSNVAIATLGVPAMIPDAMPVATTTKATLIEEEDPSLFDHNPAFPPLPDDLSVLSNHGEDIVPEPSADSDHIPIHEMMIPSVVPTEPKVEEPLTTTPADLPITTMSTEKVSETTAESSTLKVETTESASPKDNPMLNLRSAIPTELLGVPAYVPEFIGAEQDESTTTDDIASIPAILASETSRKMEDTTTEKPVQVTEEQSITLSSVSEFDTTTNKILLTTEFASSTKDQEQTTSSIAKSNVATEVTSQTELSSLPIETSDQKPHDTDVIKDKSASTTDPLMSSSRVSPTGSEVITVSRAVSGENNMFENVETTEFILTSFGSAETATDSVELIKISGDSDKNAPMIDGPVEEKKSNLLKDLINLVSDVASISDHTDSPDVNPTTGTTISDSEELIPVNVGYKSKNSNANQNSITEIPVKSKNASINKQKVVEIEDDDTDNITDSPPPNDKVEPTTRRPIIDNVSDDMHEGKTEKKDIEIITQSYVPTINRRPTKVVMKKSNEKPTADSPEETSFSVSSEMTTEGSVSNEAETAAPDVTTPEAERTDLSNSTASTAQ